MLFRNPPEINYRAIRDMGLAAWWGSALMGIDVLRTGVGEAIEDPYERHRVIDSGWRSTRGLTAGAVTSYLVGTSLVRFEGRPLENGVPRWISEGPESGLRVVMVVVALLSSIFARRLRNRATRVFEERRQQGATGEPEEVARLQRQGQLLHTVTPAAVGWLLYSHLKQDMQETRGTGLRRLFG